MRTDGPAASLNQNLILVHGSFHTGECWYRLKPMLENRGFTVQTPTLRGQKGNPRNPFLVTLKTYAQDIIASAGLLCGPSILLGHSLAGFAISAAAEQRPELFRKLIYLAAAIPKLGKSGLRDTMSQKPAALPQMQLRPTVIFPADSAKALFYNCCDPQIRSEAAERLSPQPLRPLLGKIRTTQAGLGSISKHMISCSHDQIARPADQRRAELRLSFESVQVLDSDHSPFLSNPEALAEAIKRIAAT